MPRPGRLFRRAASDNRVADDPCHAKVAEHRQPDRGEQDVRGSDVPVEDATLMRVGQRGPDRRERRDDFTDGEPASASEHIGERPPSARSSTRTAASRGDHSMQAHEVRMVQRGKQRHFGAGRAQRSGSASAIRLSATGSPVAATRAAHTSPESPEPSRSPTTPRESPRCPAHGLAG